jgi:tetratricopeptide (TPR) repeat protein
VVEDWQDLLARAFAAQGQYGEAADVLQKPGTAAPDSAFALYNLGVSLVNDGRVTQGLTILDRVGRMSVSDSESMALRDKANLTLGYHFLRSQQGATAVPIFNRVRSEGPYSNRALLGLGWAYLAPSGSRQRKAQLTDNDYDQPGFSSFSTLGALLRPGFLDSNIYQRAGMRPFLLDRMPKNQEAALRRALVPWVELLSRDPMDPAVQEGMLAIPYALDQLNAHTQAKDYYEKAIPALEETRQRLDQAMDHIKSGRMLETIIKRDADAEAGWTWKLKDLPDAPETFYLQSLLAENRYQEVLKDYRDARMLVRSLDARRNRIGELQHSYAERRAVDIPVELLFLQTKKRYGTVRYKLDPPPLLRLDKSMSPHSDANLPAAGNPPAAIRLDERMPLFDGPYERMQAVAERIDALRPQLDANANALAKILQGIAERDLGAQKKINEKYLIEARFALARVYDRGTPGDQQ